MNKLMEAYYALTSELSFLKPYYLARYTVFFEATKHIIPPEYGIDANETLPCNIYCLTDYIIEGLDLHSTTHNKSNKIIMKKSPFQS
jgi:hypothetical protein